MFFTNVQHVSAYELTRGWRSATVQAHAHGKVLAIHAWYYVLCLIAVKDEASVIAHSREKKRKVFAWG